MNDDLKSSICQRCRLLSIRYPLLQEKLLIFEEDNNIHPLRITIENLIDMFSLDKDENSDLDDYSDLITIDTLITYFIEKQYNDEC